jgi:ubiquinone/menaquinone biosynthesis C-methylase UbiE
MKPYSDPEIIAVYDRLAVPTQFAAPARDLVTEMKLTSGDRVLDVGTGTGAVLGPASAAVGDGGLTVGVDASIEMLRVNRWNAGACVVAAEAPELPFIDKAFDAVLSGFVITHFKKYEPALADMVRVLRPGGRMGVTVWGSAPNPFADLWNEVASRFISLDELKQAFKGMVPWNEWFSQQANLRQALTEAGLSDITLHRREYEVSLSTTDYLLLRELSLRGYVVQQHVGPEQWERFKHDVSDAYRDRFGDVVQYVQDVYIAVGAKPRAVTEPARCAH